MTVGAMKQAMTVSEYIGWLAFYAEKAKRATEPPKVQMHTAEDMVKAWGAG
jgi:hypothetical protein